MLARGEATATHNKIMTEAPLTRGTAGHGHEEHLASASVDSGDLRGSEGRILKPDAKSNKGIPPSSSLA